MSDDSSVKVAVRVRPLTTNEIEKSYRNIIDVIGENEIIVQSELNFKFNYVLDSNVTQEVTYEKCGKDMIYKFLKGYNVTFIAYGQSGSGKSHTMGTSQNKGDNKGLIQRCINDIFKYADNSQETADYTFYISFIEVYNEILYDLSENRREESILEIRESLSKGIHIPGMIEIPVQNSKQVVQVLDKGSMRRTTGCNKVNPTSSRSHALFTINISMKDKKDPKQLKRAKLSLVDLAGSERPHKTGVIGDTYKESVQINKGLLALGSMIKCLGEVKNTYIPYRDSKLTTLLKDSLGGNSITLLIACISPADHNIEETLNTLRYAASANHIKNKPTLNIDRKAAQISNPKKTLQQLPLTILDQGGSASCSTEIDLYKKENKDLKCQLRDNKLQQLLIRRYHEGKTLTKCIKIALRLYVNIHLLEAIRQPKLHHNQLPGKSRIKSDVREGKPERVWQNSFDRGERYKLVRRSVRFE